MKRIDKIKSMSLDEMVVFLEDLLYNEDSCEGLCCYDCMYFGTHHTDKSYIGTEYEHLYECKGCENENDPTLKVWLNKEVQDEK